MTKGLYRLRDKRVDQQTFCDWDIFRQGLLDCRAFTSYYFRRPQQTTGWLFDHKIDPPWQVRAHHAKQPNVTIVAAFGTGKTLWAAMSAAVWATLIPNFKFLNVSPVAWQSKQMFDKLKEAMAGTLFEQRFVVKIVEKPFPKITLSYELPDGEVAQSTLEFMSSNDNAQTILTWEGDWINYDQGEQDDNLSDTIRALGSRLRGVCPIPVYYCDPQHWRYADPDMPSGEPIPWEKLFFGLLQPEDGVRARLGRLSLTCNSADNPELWYIFDLAKDYPDEYLSISAATASNKNLTVQQVKQIRGRIRDPNKVKQDMEGARPVGGGILFTAEMVNKCLDDTWDAIMQAAIERNDTRFDLQQMREAGVVKWQLPYDKDRLYVVVGDPGVACAPARNSPVVIVWDVTEYPAGPMRLTGFWWGDGQGTYGNWVNQFLYWMDHYHVLQAAFDSTGGQKVHEEYGLKDHMDKIVGIDLAGTSFKKRAYLNTLQQIMERGGLSMPKGIQGITWQLLKYTLPDDKLNQDIVAAFVVLAGLLWFLGLNENLQETGFDESPMRRAPSIRNTHRARIHAPRRTRAG